MDRQKFWVIGLVLGTFLVVSAGIFAMMRSGVICAFQIRYALSYSVAHAPMDAPPVGRDEEARALHERFVPNVCLPDQFAQIFEKEAEKWGY